MRLSELGRRQRAKVFYYTSNALKLFVPRAAMRASLGRTLQRATEADLVRVADRVRYYAALPNGSVLGKDAIAVGDYEDRARWTYYFDMRSTLVHFDPRLCFRFHPGDIKFVPISPTFVKSRPLDRDNRNAVLLKLNKIRHFQFVPDRMPFLAKALRAVWRGNGRLEHRRRVLEQFQGNPRCDFGHVGNAEIPANLSRPWMSISEQLAHRYILNIEGNDVATSLKWSMASQSLCLMTPPKFETWFMEGRLVPDVHYVALAEDYSDLEAKLDHFDAHPEQALEIIRNANAFVEQFMDARNEKLIELLVAMRYFTRTGQAELLKKSQPAVQASTLGALLQT